MGVGRDVGRGCWPERLLHQQLMAGSEEQAKQAHTEQSCLPVCHRALQGFTSLPCSGLSRKPLPSTLPLLAVPRFGFPTIPPPTCI